MAAVATSSASNVLTEDCSTKNNQEFSDTPVLPSGDIVNSPAVLKSGGIDNVDTEPCERRKKTRRGKPKRKNPYNKEGNESRISVNRSKNGPRFAHRHADAPYNTNEFLMEDHSAFVNVLVKPTKEQQGSENTRPPRVRDPSFTSVESDEDHFYSSPEDEEEYLTKEFSNTYQELHIETLQSMSKYELIQQVLQLEEQVDGLEKRFDRVKYDEDQSENLKNMEENSQEDGEVGLGLSVERMKQFQLEIGRLRLENEKLQIENDRLRRQNRSSSVSSVDSESDSTTSPSSVSSLSEKEELIESNEGLNEDMDDSRENFDITPDGEAGSSKTIV